MSIGVTIPYECILIQSNPMNRGREDLLLVADFKKLGSPKMGCLHINKVHGVSIAHKSIAFLDLIWPLRGVRVRCMEVKHSYYSYSKVPSNRTPDLYNIR